ncbi:hypothetical protein [Ruegeria sp. HKCCD7255]|nr:hypothetical protein [Ruegeria sp. HKCCD7255]
MTKRHIDAAACAAMWCAAIKEHIKAAERGDESARLWLSNDGIHLLYKS